jgi:hypothetical protein
LAGSSAIENDADQVALIDHTTRATVHDGKTFGFLLDKNRHGPQAPMTLHMNTSTLRVTEYASHAPAKARPELALHDRGPRRDFYETRDAN